MRVIIAGAGIGGLTTAMALHAQGIDVQVYEAVTRTAAARRRHQPAAARDGATRTGWTCSTDCCRSAWPPPSCASSTVTVSSSGASRAVWPRATRCRRSRCTAGSSSWRCSPRPAAVWATTPCAQGTRCGHSSDDGRRVQVRTRAIGAPTTAVTDEADVLVGADGIHSTVRSTFHPDEGLPQWQGNVLWRATTRVAAVPHRAIDVHGRPPATQVRRVPDHRGRRRRPVHGELDRRARSHRRGAGPTREDWNRRGDLADFLPRFADWLFDWLDVPADGAPPRRPSSSRWSIATRCLGGPTVGSRCWVTLRTRCTPSGRTARRRRSSTR